MKRISRAAVAGAVLAASVPGLNAGRTGTMLQSVLPLEGDIAGVHDPAVIKDGNSFYRFQHRRPRRAGRDSDPHVGALP